MSAHTPRRIRPASLAVGAAMTLLLFGTPIQAADLDQAKQQGSVCELPTGYLSAEANAPGDVRAMVDRINAKRREKYGRIANEHGISPEQVGKMTAKKLEPRCR